VIASLIETCKLNRVDPRAYLSATITKIINGHPNTRIDELLPWVYQPSPCSKTWLENTAYERYLAKRRQNHLCLQMHLQM
jgi:IS66 C-terminal element